MAGRLVKVGDDIIFNTAHMVRAWWSDDDELKVELVGAERPLSFRDDAGKDVWVELVKLARERA